MALRLGHRAEALTVHLSPGEPFVCWVDTEDGLPWPVGVQCSIEFAPATIPPWVPVVQGPSLAFDVPAATVDEVIAAGPTRVRLVFDGLVHSAGCVQVGH